MGGHDGEKRKGRPARISFKSYDAEKGAAEVIEANARFHCWGIRKAKVTDERPRMPAVETVGICELETGEVRLVLPEKIKFLDKGVSNEMVNQNT